MEDVYFLTEIIYKNFEIINILIVFMSLKNKINLKRFELENISTFYYSIFLNKIYYERKRKRKNIIKKNDIMYNYIYSYFYYNYYYYYYY